VLHWHLFRISDWGLVEIVTPEPNVEGRIRKLVTIDIRCTIGIHIRAIRVVAMLLEGNRCIPEDLRRPEEGHHRLILGRH